jgi:hypothetical protein
MLPLTLQFLIAMIASAINERLQRKLDYALEEVRGGFVKTIKYECLNQFVIFGERHLRHLIKEFVEHYMTERFHQGIGGQLIRNVGPTNDNGADGKVACRSRLGGLLNCFHRETA